VNYGFQLEACSDTYGGQNVGFANNGDYLDYNIYIPEAREYTFKLRVASAYSNGSISFRLGDGSTFTALKAVSIAATGGWQTWTTMVFQLDLPQGNHTFRIFSLAGEYNINWFEFSLPADVNEIPQLKQFRIYPNPSNGSFMVDAEFSEKTPAHFTIYDMLGNIMLNYSIERTTSFSKRIDGLASRPGIYFLNLKTEMGSVTRKVIVN
jgi:endoglucanase